MRSLKRRGLTERDRAIWASYTSLVAPLPGVTPLDPPAPSPPLPVTAPAPLAPVARAPIKRTTPLVVGTSPGGVDNGTWTRFRTGKLPAARTLDLHGRTAQRAHATLEHFLHSAAAEGLRCVEIITGRGSGESGGVIRREFPLWLNQPNLRHLILAAAHPHALNPGSVRLLLRRSRSPSPPGRGQG